MKHEEEEKSPNYDTPLLPPIYQTYIYLKNVCESHYLKEWTNVYSCAHTYSKDYFSGKHEKYKKLLRKFPSYDKLKHDQYV